MVEGRNLQGDWFFLRLSPSVECWVLASTGTPSGDPSGLRVMIAIPTPTFTALPPQRVNCAQYKDIKSCQSVRACVWQSFSTTAGGKCVNR